MTAVALIVDDSLTVRMDLVDTFVAAGIDARSCATLAEARAALAREEVGLVVLDVLLPDGDGIDLLGELRASPGTRDLPVLLLSGETAVRDRVRGLRMGADDYVGKPYDRSRLLARARDLLGLDHGRTPPVLVLDDSPTFRRALAEALSAAGYAVVEAETAREALAVLSERRFAAVLVDGVLPDLDGPAVIRRIRVQAATRALPCLLLTGSDDGASQVAALEAGADDFVRKSEDLDVVLARLAALLRRHAETAAPGAAIRTGPRRILLFEGESDDLAGLAALLSSEGYEVQPVRSVEETRELLALERFECMLVAPDRTADAIALCRSVRESPGSRETPVILLAKGEDRAAMLKGLEAGADDYVALSSGHDVVRARILAQTRRKALEDETRLHRAERLVAETRAQLVGELESQVEARTRELELAMAESRHAERMASLGMLSASIAHEINNPLALVLATLDLARRDALRSVDPAATLRALVPQLDEALDAAGRVREIVGDLRIFARSSDDDEPLASVDLRAVLETAIRMARNEIRHRATLDFVPVAMPPVRGSHARLGQVFLNILVNAAQAIQLGRAGDNSVRITMRDGGAGAEVEIADTGVGIPADRLTRIFDPFYTTKPRGVGTGLGLAICKRIVTGLGGTISVASVEGRGTTFRIFLPYAEAQPVPPPPGPEAEADAAPLSSEVSRARILVVDDEARLVRTIERILVPAHDVVTAVSARAALDLIAGGARFDAILSDVMMPDMTGIELHAALARRIPEQAARMAFMTGGVFEPEAARFLGSGTHPVIEKPFRPAELRAAVSAALGRFAATGAAVHELRPQEEPTT